MDDDASHRTADRRPVRVALAAGVVFGLAHLAAVPLLRPSQVALASSVYRAAGEAFLAGGDPYAASPASHPGYPYIYPPVVLFAVVPHALAGSALGAFALQTAANLLTAAALAFVLTRYLEDVGVSLARLDRLLVAGFVLASVHSVPNLVMGQVNLQLALAVAVGAVLLERERPGLAGVAFALAATVKLFPAVVGAWLLRRREWRAVGAAVATGTGLFVLGVLAVGPAHTRTYLTEVLPNERHADAFAGGLDPGAMYVTVRRPLSAAMPAVDPTVLSLMALALLVPVVVAASWSVATRTERLVALLATVLATLVYLPLEPFYYALLYFPLVPLLYLLEPGRVRGVFLAGTVALSAVVSYSAVQGTLALAPLPGDLVATLDGVARAVFSVAQPPLLGAALLLAGCVLFQYEAATRRSVPDDARRRSAE